MKKFFTRKPAIVLSLILILAFFLRAQETISGNFLFLIDQGRDLMDVKRIVFDHHLTLIGPYTSLGGVFQGPLYYYLLAVGIFIFQGNPWGAMLVTLIISLAVLIVVYFFMRKLFGVVPALMATYLFAISPEAISAATYFWNPHSMWLVIVLFIFVLYKTVQNNKYQIFLWPTVALSTHFQTAFGVFLFLATVITMLLLYRKLLFSKQFVYGLALSILVISPQIVFDLRHNFLMSSSVFKIFSGSDQGLFTTSEKSSYANLLQSHITALLNNFYSGFIQVGYFSILPKLVLVFLLICTPLFYIQNKFKKHEKKFVVSLLSITAIIVLLSLFYPFPLRYWFLTGFQSFYLLLTAVVLSVVWRKGLGKVVIGLLLISTFIYSIARLQTIYFNPPDDGGIAKIKGKLAAVDFIYSDAKDKNFGILIFTPPVNTDAYDYLIWWRGKEKYHYIPHTEKRGTVYLLIEPDPHQEWTYRGWLETVIKDGKVLETKNLPSGHIIQKRQF